ncbi:MAG: CpaF family protein [Candidatus Peregrinibacteria bacterium]|nr:CpaF family protein [Candidatus Peregrinibacteria bacterium]MDZ4244366.1 CpaF family protein [Candidatus Gracilibacteria bacterium]
MITSEQTIHEIEEALHKKLFHSIKKSESFNKFELEKEAMKLIEEGNYILPTSIKKIIVTNIINKITGLGPLEVLMQDSTVTEVMVNGKDDIFVEQNGKLQKTDIKFQSDESLLQVINRIVSRIGRRIDESSPLVDARLPDGSRVNAIIPPLSLTGPILTIRKFPEKSIEIADLLKFNSLSDKMAEFLYYCILSKQNMIISGGTGSGKTSLLNVCANLIPKDQRVITIEDAAEIKLDLPHLIRLESKAANMEGKGSIAIRTLLKNALRMRPDRIIVGEIRGAEAIDMLQAMNTGHDGSLTTVHANAPREALIRTETMVLMANLDLPLPAIRNQIISSIDIIIQQERDVEGKRRITHISEIDKNFNSTEYKVNDIFVYSRETMTHVPTGFIPKMIKKFKDYNIDVNEDFFK